MAMRCTKVRQILAKTLAPFAVGIVCLVCPGPSARAQTVASGASASGVRIEVVDGKPRYTNRLIESKSPYLQLHAHNPVDWFPWGDEAFDKARREGKALFVSIGYSTCHWCHVMEQESFSDPAMAAIMNEYFVCIKVDREERPDIDRVYMSFLQTTTGSGWCCINFSRNVSPSIRGISTSRINTSGRSSAILSRAAYGSTAVPTTSMSSYLESCLSRRIRKTAESSMTSTRIMANVAPDRRPQYIGQPQPVLSQGQYALEHGAPHSRFQNRCLLERMEFSR